MTVEFDRQKLRRFENSYVEAKANGETEFIFDGQTWLVEYAKHVIIYLNEVLVHRATTKQIVK